MVNLDSIPLGWDMGFEPPILGPEPVALSAAADQSRNIITHGWG